MNPIHRRLAHLISCRDATQLISRRSEQSLSAIERWKLTLHLSVCKACHRFDQQMALLGEAMRRYRR